MHNDMTHQFQVARPTLTASFFALCMTLLTQMNAQENALKITPLQPFIGKFSASYERVLGPKTALMVEYQNWFEHRQTGTAFVFPALIANSNETVTNEGHRWGLYLRQYAKTAMQGIFGELGAYAGQHDLQATTQTSVLLFFGETETKKYPNVHVSGVRFGGGWHRAKGHFSLEISGGLSVNNVPDNARLTLGMQPVSPYSRLAVGVNF
jgi:hypothetical protein